MMNFVKIIFLTTLLMALPGCWSCCKHDHHKKNKMVEPAAVLETSIDADSTIENCVDHECTENVKF